jgi:hypothetical protein
MRALPLGLRCFTRADGASNRARRALRLSRRRGAHRAADAADDALRAGRGRDRRAARAGAVRAPDAAARRAGDLRGGTARRSDLAADRLREGRTAAAVARRTAGRRRDHVRRRARRPFRPAPGAEAARPGAGGGDRRALWRRREGDHAAVRRSSGVSQHRPRERRPRADRDRPCADDEHRQLLRRRRRPRGGRVHDHCRGDGDHRVRSEPPRTGRARGAHRRRSARLPDLQLPARVELYGRLRCAAAGFADGDHHGRGRRQGRGRGVARDAADSARGAVSGHHVRGAEAPEVPPAVLSRRQRAFPPSDGAHRLLQPPHDRLPVRVDAAARGHGAGAAVRPLQRPQRALRHRLDARDACDRVARGRRQRVSRIRARDPQVQALGRDSFAAAAPRGLTSGDRDGCREAP